MLLKRVIVLLALFAISILLYSCTGGEAKEADPTPGYTPTTAAPKVDIKLDGKLLIAKDKAIWTWSGGSTKQLTKEGALRQPAWSPDGKKIAYVRIEDGYSDIWVMNAGGDGQSNLTRFGRAGADTWAFNPRWSPDGTQIAYVSDQNTYDLALWSMKADGSGRRQVSIMNDYLGGIDWPTWHPKGDRITFTAYRTGKAEIWTLNLATSKWEQVTDTGGAHDPRWSSSGDMLAFSIQQGGKSDVYVELEPDGKPLQISTDGVSRAPAWSPDGKTLAYICGQGAKFDIWAVNVDRAPDDTLRVSTPKRVTSGLGLDPASGISWIK